MKCDTGLNTDSSLCVSQNKSRLIWKTINIKIKKYTNQTPRV